jgi:uncharacterized MAPEG superfamily protein
MMQEWLVPYGATIWCLGIMGGLLLAQLIVLDVAGMRAHHVPGAAVAADHDVFLFRASRAHANTNETLAAFALLAMFGILHNASPGWLNLAAVVFVSARIGHMLSYYADQRKLRSIAFVVAFLALAAMLVLGVAAGLR